MTKFIALATALILSIPSISSADEPYADKALVAFLDSLTDSNSFYPRTLDFLSNVKDPESLVVLTNYYIGEGGSEVLGQLITQRGRAILPLLQRELDWQIRCNQKYMKACWQNRTKKTEMILEYISAIKSGKVLCPDFNSCPAPNTQLVPTPETARHVSWDFRGRRGTAARYA